MINVFAPINNLGYGILSNNIIKALHELGQELVLFPIGEIQPDPHFQMYWTAARENWKNFNSSNPSLFLFHDEHSYQSCGMPNIVLSMFETTKLKEKSKLMLDNGPATTIITTTKDHRTILEDNGIQKSIEVVNCGVDDSIYNTISLDCRIETNKYTFITVGKREKRKNTDMIIQAFIDSCRGKEAALIAHTFNPFMNQTKDHPFKNLVCWSGVNPLSLGLKYEGFIGKAHKFSDGKCDLYFTTPDISAAEMPSLYQSANVGIQYSSAEGWDLPLIELMACGIPSITTRCLGHREFINEETPAIQADLAVDMGGLEKAEDGMWFKGDLGEWEIADEEALRQKIDTCLKNEVGIIPYDNLADWTAEQYNWHKPAQKLIELCGV